ncbi:testis-specific H1 histone-like [Palaemon carinicauda]|uniref:testis-specific H1 histone-like n=1 Tax=Palaemon carinicauda TaxID=392227 RepID=UPI0035B688F1
MMQADSGTERSLAHLRVYTIRREEATSKFLIACRCESLCDVSPITSLSGLLGTDEAAEGPENHWRGRPSAPARRRPSARIKDCVHSEGHQALAQETIGARAWNTVGACGMPSVCACAKVCRHARAEDCRRTHTCRRLSPHSRTRKTVGARTEEHWRLCARKIIGTHARDHRRERGRPSAATRGGKSEDYWRACKSIGARKRGKSSSRARETIGASARKTVSAHARKSVSAHARKSVRAHARKTVGARVHGTLLSHAYAKVVLVG